MKTIEAKRTAAISLIDEVIGKQAVKFIQISKYLVHGLVATEDFTEDEATTILHEVLESYVYCWDMATLIRKEYPDASIERQHTILEERLLASDISDIYKVIAGKVDLL